ncbi:MAG: hypothetical protein ACK41W_01725 [Cyanobacteriota bacterium]
MRPELDRLIEVDNLPLPLRAQLLPALAALVEQVQPQGLWLFGSWARRGRGRLSTSITRSSSGRTRPPAAKGKL